MIRQESPEETAFRDSVRTWLEDNLPRELRHLTFRPRPEEIMPWYRAVSRQGWIAPHWPRDEGGMGASAVEQAILMEEFARAGAPDIPSQGLNHIGPMLIERGTPEQKARHLPPILSGDCIWCQGYSEPGAGSDLASLKTTGRIDGDAIVVNGHKIWTTWGHHAQWMFALVRTSDDRKRGITFVLLDLDTPGITRRPIRTIAGDDEFAEVFLDEVRVPLANVVGEIGAGWSVATSLLDQERLHIGSPLHANRALTRLRGLVEAMPEGDRDAWADSLAHAEVLTETVTAAFLDTHEKFEAGRSPAGESAFLKILATEATQEILEIARCAAGPLAAQVDPAWNGDRRLDLNEMALQSRRLTIYAGSNEIQRTILARQVLGLGGR
ncbi:acyl-CoA dehydrogenase family protein [Amorphus coralli]|uniref:acyl-CoA dehydrogenase family protein n=1 Tax=Amorphus coralli TaxID=340680 RepID=UPI000382DAD0|nr:acyl-CoA dehydrogenase family protein [Amorphus coralli]